MKTYKFFLIIIFSICCNFFNYANLYSQTIGQTIAFADKQYKLKNYEIALENYNRVLFFSNSNNNLYLYKQISNIYYEIQEYNKAIKYFDLFLSACEIDSIKHQIIFQKIDCYIRTQKFQYALIELFNINDSVPTNILQQKNFYLGICFFGLENFKSSEKYFNKSLTPSCIEQKQAIHELFLDKKLNKPNPKTAFILSIILPGSGQIYTGNIYSGINSLLLSSTIIILGVYLSYQYTILDAVLVASPWFLRYYQGGVLNSKKFAEQKLQNNRNEIFNKILVEIIECKCLEK